MTPRLIAGEIYRRSTYGGKHPLAIPRVSTVVDLARALGWLDADTYITSPRARPQALQAWHTPTYLDALQAAEAEGDVSDAVRERHALGTMSNPIFPEMFRRPATAAGAAILAGARLAAPGMIYSPASGTHHGMPDRANGFCYLNDVVFAILSLRASGLRRIAYIDIDAHHPDGVEHAFGADPDVLMISTHEEGRWPRTGALEDRGAGNVWNLPLPAGTDDSGAQAAWDMLIVPRLQAFRPEAIVLQCGADAVLEDPLSRLAWSNRAHWRIVSGLKQLTDRLLVTGGGGYNPWSVGRLWTGVWATIQGAEIPERLPTAAEAVLRDLSWPARAMGKAPPEHWFTTLADTPREGPVPEEVRSRLKALSERAEVWV
ncbi:MAG: acetoin utilization protein AcuC [Pseudomonadota bacterium]